MHNFAACDTSSVDALTSSSMSRRHVAGTSAPVRGRAMRAHRGAAVRGASRSSHAVTLHAATRTHKHGQQAHISSQEGGAHREAERDQAAVRQSRSRTTGRFSVASRAPRSPLLLSTRSSESTHASQRALHPHPSYQRWKRCWRDPVCVDPRRAQASASKELSIKCVLQCLNNVKA